MAQAETLIWTDAVQLAADLRHGHVSAREVLTAHLDRIQAVDPSVNAMVTVAADRAHAMAKAADQAHANGEPIGLLHGIPVAHKDLANTQGIRTTLGSPLYADHVPETNALVVQRSIDAGAISIGKTNTPEFGAGSHTFNEVFGMTRNPYDPSRTCGGSSGGAAVVLASGMAPLADGSDMGGSLRNPAAFCNVVGLRPTPGRVPASRASDPWGFLATEGPMARTVADVALFLAALAGPDIASPMALESPGASFAGSLEPFATPQRIAWAPDLGGLPVETVIRDALTSVPQIMADLGHNVGESAPDLAGADEIFAKLRAWAFALAWGPTYLEHRDQMKSTVQWNIQAGLDLTIEEHLGVSRRREALYGRVIEFFADWDYLVCPVTQVEPFPVETEWVAEIQGVEMKTYIEWMRACTDVTVMNCPAISVPAGFTPDGLPVGLQIVGRPRDDLGVLRLAHQFEQATQVGLRRPPLDGAQAA